MTSVISKIQALFFGGVSFLLLSGCTTVENQHLAKLPFFEARTDVIPGLDSPHQRKKIIQEKGSKGATAPKEEREILVAQLVHEYKTSPDHNMRREAVDALAKIPHPDRDRYLQEILRDDDPSVRRSALEAMGKTYSSGLPELTRILLDRSRNDADRDVRLTAVRILGDVCPNHKNESRLGPTEKQLRESVIVELGGLLDDRVHAVRYEAMQSLHRITGKDYGNDVNRWTQYVRYVQNEVPDLPPQRSFAEKIPTIALPMFK